MAALLIYNGLRWPYGRLKNIAKQRAEAVQNNMLIAITIMESLSAAGKTAQEGAQCAAQLGGPFCAVLNSYLASLAMKPEDPDEAMEKAKSYLPDINNLDAVLFLDAIKDSEKARGRFWISFMRLVLKLKGRSLMDQQPGHLVFNRKLSFMVLCQLLAWLQLWSCLMYSAFRSVSNNISIERISNDSLFSSKTVPYRR